MRRPLSAIGLLCFLVAPAITAGGQGTLTIRAAHCMGLPGDAVLRAATSDAADAIGAGKQLGRLAPGMLADLLIVDGDPLADPLELVRLEMVFSNGVPGARATLPTLSRGRPQAP